MHGDDTVELVDIVTLAGRTTTTRLLIRRSAEIVDSKSDSKRRPARAYEDRPAGIPFN
jgi:hypothetical protein